MIPELFSIPLPFIESLPIYTFGFFMLCCFLGAMKLLEKQLRKANLDTAIAEQMVTWAAIGGIVGARLLSVVSHPSHLINDPLGTIFSSSGFVFYGGFIGGFIAAYLVVRSRSLSVLPMLDLVAAPLAFGYGIGRIGCQLSGDGDYGIESTLPWAMNYAYGVVPTMSAVHPTPVYETIGAFLLTFLLLNKSFQKILPYEGQLFGVYLIGSALFRFLVEFLRIEPILFLNLTQAQVFALALLLPGLYLLIFNKNKHQGFFNKD